VIAVIDTGVDYLHPDLGGCLGAGCRVIGGYDVVDDDNDPTDEHGHGTHVAGIAAGTGLSSGVAQEAKLLAYRALDENGSGSTSDVVEAIERAVNDGAHIINLSLGESDGKPDSPQNLAVREAVRRGVLVVAAAGNSGPQWGTVGSPGNEVSALTVGALGLDDKVARFSSRGPDRSDYTLKPDISAPGVNILSAVPGGGHMILSGTSMATPYVAGVAALLIEMAPESDVLSLRSRIIQSATPLSEPVWEIGLGKVNGNLEQYRHVSAHPTSISAKLATQYAGAAPQQVDITLKVWNFDIASTLANVVIDLPEGVSATVPTNITVPSDGLVEVPITLMINPDQVSYPTTTPPIHLGAIRLFMASDTLTIPVSVAKPSELQMEFQSPPSLVVIHDRKGNYEIAGVASRFVDLQIGAGTYDIWALRDADATKWVMEGLKVEGSTSLTVLETDAKYTLRFDLRDPDGAIVGACGYSRDYLEHKPSGLGLLYQYHRSCPETSDHVIQTQISDLSSNMGYEVSHVAYGSATQYEYLRFPFRLDGGLSSNQLLRSGGDDFRTVDWSYHLPPGVTKASFMRLFDSRGGNTYMPASWLKAQIQHPWLRREHLIANPSANFAPFRGQYDAIFAIEGEQLDPDNDEVLMLTPSMSVTTGDSLSLRLAGIPTSRNWVIPHSGEALVVGSGPDSWTTGSMAFRESEVRIPTSNPWFAGWNREVRMGGVELEILGQDGSRLLHRHVNIGIPNFNSIHPDHWITHNYGAGNQTLRLSRTGTWLGTRAQTTTVNVRLNPQSVQLAQDCIDRLAILDSNGKPIQSADWSTGVEVVIEGTDCGVERTVTLTHWASQISYQLEPFGAEQQSNSRHTYPLPYDLPSGHYDLHIQLGDDNDTQFEHHVSPALAITHQMALTNPPSAPVLSSPSARQFVFDSQVALTWEDQSGVDEYRVQLSNHGDFSNLTTDSLVVSMAIHVPVHGYGLTWYWRVSARNDEGWGPWSTRRSFTTVIESTSLSDDNLPYSWYLGQNYPNPFNPSTTIQFGIGVSEVVRLDIISLSGQHVKTVDLGLRHPGTHAVTVDLSHLASGLYLYQISTPSFRQVKKMTLIK
jgi:hypothetical protein